MNQEDFDKIFPFETSRQFQKEIVEAIDTHFETNQKKFIIACLPTAIGKSAISVALGRKYGPTYFLTSQKSLQQQYINDFSPIGMQMVQGKYNYKCNLNTELKCDMGICITNPKVFERMVRPADRTNPRSKVCKACPYIIARNNALESPLTSMNYTYFFNMVRSDELLDKDEDARHIKKRALLVCDEAHNVEQSLISFMSTSLSVLDFKKFELGRLVKIPKVSNSEEDKFKWLFTECLNDIVKREADELTVLESMDQGSSNYYKQSRKTKYLDTIKCMICRLRDQLHSTDTPGVCIQSNQFEITFKPLFADKIAQSYLYQFADRVLFMSATVFDKKQFCKNAGINIEECSFITCTSPIPAKNRPIKLLNAVNLSYKNKEQNKPKLKRMVKEILDNHQRQRGIIHTVSYDIANYLVEELRDDRLILPTGKERDQMIRDFFSSKRDDLVLISPSLTEGISLDNDYSRFSIICKLPFANLGDTWIKTRMEFDSNWYATETVNNLVQMTGRVVRSPEDTGTNYILDNGFPYFFQNNHQRFPKWWKDSLETVKIGDLWK